MTKKQEPVDTSTETAKTPEIADNVERSPQWNTEGYFNSGGLVTAGKLNNPPGNVESNLKSIDDMSFSEKTVAIADAIRQSLFTLKSSDIVSFDKFAGWKTDVTWRTGHLEHIARLYASDPVQTERDYHDDVTVAKAYSGDQFAALVEEARE